LIRFKIEEELAFSSGCKRGPMDIDGLITTNLMSYSLKNFLAASSAEVFANAYHL